MLAGLNEWDARLCQHPIWVLAVQLALATDHFRLDPETKLHVANDTGLRNGRQPGWKFILIYLPVTKGPTIVSSPDKPAVVEDKSLYTERRCMLDELHGRGGIDIKIQRLPGV